MAKKRRRTTKKRPVKSKLAGYTRVKGKYALVFKKGKQLRVGSGRYKSKSSLMSGAKRYLR